MARRFAIADGTPETNSHWLWDTEKNGKPIVTVDFHHTISTTCGIGGPGERHGGLSAGEPQPGARAALTQLRRTFRVIVFTGHDGDGAVSQIKAYMAYHRLPYDEVLSGKPKACFMIDDRAVHHQSWDTTMREIEERMGRA